MKPMTSRNDVRIAVAAAALTIFGCGGSGSTAAQTTASVDSAGATLNAGQATLSIPAGALAGATSVTLREAEPQAGRVARYEMEPKDLQLTVPAWLSVRVDDDNVKVKVIRVEDEIEHQSEMEVEDRNHHLYKASLDKLGELEIEVEHARVCAEACSPAEECDDGVCKPHEEDEDARMCSAVCDPGLECDDGMCKPHGGGRDGRD